MSDYHARRRRKFAREGKCLWCGTKRKRGHALCEGCRARQRECYAEKLAAGMCTRCGEPADGWACAICREKHNAARQARRGA